MDQLKIGRFIAERRKEEGLTQLQLAERLSITDRAVSKWECGRAMPDHAIIPELCKILKITVNDLFCGEVVKMENYAEKMEKNLMEMTRKKEEADRRLLFSEIITGVICIIILLTLCAIAAFVEMEEWLQITLILTALVPVLIAMPFMIKIEQTAGYYECKKCASRHIPAYGSVFISMHCGRTRYMRCPKCGRRSWQKKVINKE